MDDMQIDRDLMGLIGVAILSALSAGARYLRNAALRLTVVSVLLGISETVAALVGGIVCYAILIGNDPPKTDYDIFKAVGIASAAAHLGVHWLIKLSMAVNKLQHSIGLDDVVGKDK